MTEQKYNQLKSRQKELEILASKTSDSLELEEIQKEYHKIYLILKSNSKIEHDKALWKIQASN